MKTLILYASTHGTSRKVAGMIAEKISNSESMVHDLKTGNLPNLDDFDKIILGGSIHAGQMQSAVKKFGSKYHDLLLKKPLGLFIVGMEKNPSNKKMEIENAFPETLRKHASMIQFAGGEFLFEKMNLLQRLIIKKISNIDQTVSSIDETAIAAFSEF